MSNPQSDLQVAGLSTYRNAALKATAQKVKGDAVVCRLYGWKVQNLDAADAYLQIYDKASPTVGTDTPKLSIWLPASGGDDLILPKPIEFDNAIYVAATTTLGGSTAPTNGELINLLYF
jgi:hypothetical protein